MEFKETEKNIINNPIFLILDTETNGLPKKIFSDGAKKTEWPRLVSLAYILVDINKEVIYKHYTIIKPVGFTLDNTASEVHRISQNLANTLGRNLKQELFRFIGHAQRATYIVAHNLEFDYNVLKEEFGRVGIPYLLSNIPGICTMKQSSEYCGFRLSNGLLKWPKLSDLHYMLFKEFQKESHHAMEDAKCTLECFFKLLERDVIKLPTKTEKLNNIEIMKIQEHIASIRSFIESLSYADNISSRQIGALSDKIEALFETLTEDNSINEYENTNNITAKISNSTGVNLEDSFDIMDDDLPF